MANERRLIDLNELGIGRCNPDAFPLNNRGYCAGWNGVISLLEKAPTVNAVEVCFCKDCKYWEPIQYGHRTDGLCLCLSKYHDAERPGTEGDFYCAYGEKREVE